MKKFLYILLLCLGFSGYAQKENTSLFLHVDGKRIVDSHNSNVLLRGIGLGGYMLQEGYMLKVPFSGQQHVIKQHIQELIGEEKTEEFYRAWRSNFIQKKDVDSLKAWGFNSIRLPMHYNLYTLPVEKEPVKGENTWLQEGFRMTDSLVSWCKANDMYLILDMHATPGGQGHDVNISDRDPSKPSLWESEPNQQKLIALWEKLAKRYKDEPTVGAYDIINEPNWSFEKGKNKNGIEDSENKPLRKLMVRITEAIRKIDQNHIIIIDGNGWGNNYNGVLPPWDGNMVLSFHKYWNYNNTEAIQKYLDYRDQYNIPIWLGESGENSNAWFTDAIALMEKNNIGWCWWPLKKLGSNNPLQIRMNAGYQNILNYWEGKAEKPSEEEAFESLMQLARNTRIENCIVHDDVIDAMMRQPHSEETLPYRQVSVSGNAEIPATDYDLGNNGIAYKDINAGNYYVSTGTERQRWNNGGAYRNDGVDIYSNNDQVYVGDTEKGEWLQYTFQVDKEGPFQVSFRLSSEEPGGKVNFNINGTPAGELTVPDTEGQWKWAEAKKIHLQKGENRLVFKIQEGGFNFDKIKIQKLKEGK